MSKGGNKKSRKLGQYFEFTLVRMMMGLINAFPIAVSTRIARGIGGFLFSVLTSRRKVAVNNLAIAFGDSKSEQERHEIAKESFRHIVTSLVEFFRLPNSVEKIKPHVRLKGVQHLDRAFARGKGVVLIMSHLGPWEYLGFLTYLKQYPTTVLGRPIRNPYFYKWVKLLRKAVKLDYRDKDLGPRKLLSGLRANHLIAITIDQWAGNEGIWVDFFGVSTSTISLPARLAKKTGCALIAANCIRVGSGEYQINILPEVSIDNQGGDWVQSMTRKLNSVLEEQISAHPEQWLWVHKRWKGRRR